MIIIRHINTHRMLTLAVLAAAVVLCACKRVPDHVIQPDDMAELLADIHTAESAVDLNYQKFVTDSSRKVVKQAIFKKHGVTAQQFDTSMVWYGAHLDRYMDVYDHVDEILQKRLEHNTAVASQQASLSLAGDSVDVWAGSRRFAMDNKSETHNIFFSSARDANWEKGDMYTWRAKIMNNPGQSAWKFVTEYSDGTLEVLNTSFSAEGWQEMSFYTDSTRQPERIYGVMIIGNQDRPLYIDSMQMVRKRLDTDKYRMRYRQKHYDVITK